MTTEQLQWLLITASNAPIQSTVDAKTKASVMIELIEQLEKPETRPLEVVEEI